MSSERLELTIAEAAEVLGVSRDAIRKRIQRGSLDAEKDGRRWIVSLPADAVQDAGRNRPGHRPDAESGALLAELRGRVDYLERQVEAERERAERAEQRADKERERVDRMLDIASQAFAQNVLPAPADEQQQDPADDDVVEGEARETEAASSKRRGVAGWIKDRL